MPEAAAGGYPAIISSVMATGEPFYGRELPVTLARTDGEPPEERLIDLVYLPLLESDGSCTRVLGHGTDVTAHVLARRTGRETAGPGQPRRAGVKAEAEVTLAPVELRDESQILVALGGQIPLELRDDVVGRAGRVAVVVSCENLVASGSGLARFTFIRRLVSAVLHVLLTRSFPVPCHSGI